MTTRRGAVLVVLGLGLVVLAPGLEAQCAMCRTALEASEQGRMMAAGLNRAILVLLGAPFVVAALVGGAVVLGRRRLRSTATRDALEVPVSFS